LIVPDAAQDELDGATQEFITKMRFRSSRFHGGAEPGQAPAQIFVLISAMSRRSRQRRRGRSRCGRVRHGVTAVPAAARFPTACQPKN